MDKHDGVFLIFVVTVVTTVSAGMIAFGGFEELNTATGDQPHNVDDVADHHGRTQTISETVASWAECMDMAQERINYGTDQTYIIAQMEWDIAVCDRLFSVNGIAEPDLVVP